jgi:hypothetical protein
VNQDPFIKSILYLQSIPSPSIPFPVIVIFLSRYSYYDDLVLIANSYLEMATSIPEFSVNGTLLNYLDILSLVILLLISLFLCAPVLYIEYYFLTITSTYPNEALSKYFKPYLVELPFILRVSIFFTFESMEATSSNAWGHFRYEPKLLDFITDYTTVSIATIFLYYIVKNANVDFIGIFSFHIVMALLVIYISGGTISLIFIVFICTYII